MNRQFTIVLFAFFTIFGLLNTAQAQIKEVMTALQLEALCTSRYDVDAGFCAGYVTAVAERLMSESSTASGGSTGRVCLSPAITPETLITHVRSVWQTSPPTPQDFAAESVELALRQRFECP